jgi:hypothetical protein
VECCLPRLPAIETLEMGGTAELKLFRWMEMEQMDPDGFDKMYRVPGYIRAAAIALKQVVIDVGRVVADPRE